MSSQTDLNELVLGFRRNLYFDLLHHGNILDTTFSNIWQSPTIFAPRSTFWMYSSSHISDYCKSIYGGIFKRIGRTKGGLGISSGAERIGYTPGSRRTCFFIGNGDKVVKVYRFLWPKVSVPDLAAALHEAAATSYICPLKKWFCSVFGLVTKGDCATYVHICLCRDQLEEHGKLDPSGVTEAIKDLFLSIGVVHGDGHAGNVMKKQLIDFERSFLPISSCTKDEIMSSIQNYAENRKDMNAILDQHISKQGLDFTRNQFITFASECLLAPVSRQLFDFDMDFFLRLFTLKSP
jgi:hypothetical protein